MCLARPHVCALARSLARVVARSVFVGAQGLSAGWMLFKVISGGEGLPSVLPPAPPANEDNEVLDNLLDNLLMVCTPCASFTCASMN